MTPAEERAVLNTLSDGVEDAVREAFEELVKLIREGVAPREAVAQVMVPLQADVVNALNAALAATIGAPAMATEAPVVLVELSRRLYSQSASASATVADIVTRHTRGLQDARALALELFQGYGFRDSEVLNLSPRNDALPQYLRELLRQSSGIERDLSRAFARVQVKNLSTPALRAAYTQLLEAIDGVEAGKGQYVLDNRLKVAFFERMRYFSNRIAQTELHRAYMRQEARALMDDKDVEYVQVRRAPGRQTPCICSLYTGRDKYGFGAGVYPKALAPRPPFHPFCRCVVSPRLDLTGKKPRPENDEADAYFLRRVGEPLSARIVGSREKLAAVLNGAKPEDIQNASTPGPYKVRTIGEPA